MGQARPGLEYWACARVYSKMVFYAGNVLHSKEATDVTYCTSHYLRKPMMQFTNSIVK